MEPLKLQEALRRLLDTEPYLLTEKNSYSRLAVLVCAWKLAENLPESAVVMNLFEDRVPFTIVMLAVALKGGTVILPPSLAENVLLQLMDSVSSQTPKIVVGERLPTAKLLSLYLDLNWLNVLEDTSCSYTKNIESINTLLESALLLESQIWLFTSGTTGAPKKVVKTWFQMLGLAQKAIDRFSLNDPKVLIATVPSQHMFGLETTFFWPLFSQATLWHGQPLFPADVHEVISVQTLPVFLISTPLHLQKIVSDDLNWDVINGQVLSATSPLSLKSARSIWDKLHLTVFEVFGSTETASIASRSILKSEDWQLYSNNVLTVENEHCYVDMIDLAERYELQDDITVLTQQTFKLRGRPSDLIKIAGKRTSLAGLNCILLGIEGIQDGVFWMPKDAQRLSALVVTHLTVSRVKAALLKEIDSVFMPRPIQIVKSIPRTPLGKVQVAELTNSMRHQQKIQ